MISSLKVRLGFSLIVAMAFSAIRAITFFTQPTLAREFEITSGDLVTRFIIFFLAPLLMTSRGLKGLNQDNLHVLLFRILIRNIIIAIALAFIMDVVICQIRGSHFRLYMFAVSTVIVLSLIVGVVQFYISSIAYNRVNMQALIEKEKIEKEKYNIELSALKSQLNPHFFFNALNTLNGLIMLNPEKAIKYNEQLSEVFRYIVQSRNVNLVALKDEIEFVKSYFEVFKTRFGENISLEMNIPPKLMDDEIPNLSFQLLMENVIKHNEISNQKPLKISIGYEQGNLVFSNNRNLKQLETSTGFGLSNLNKRYNLILNEDIQIKQFKERFSVLLPLKERQ